MSKHTKLPWAIHNGGHIQNDDIEVIVWGSGLASKNRLNNSRFIVKACNNHHKLLDALKEIHRQGVSAAKHDFMGDDYHEALNAVWKAIKDAS